MGKAMEKVAYSTDGSEKYIVRKSYDKSEVYVLVLKEQVGSTLGDILGENDGRVYAMKGVPGNGLPTTGKYAWSIRSLLEDVKYDIDRYGCYVGL